MGRQKLYHTPEEKAAAVKEWRKSAKSKTKNISVDGDLVELLNRRADTLEGNFGFRPTISQTLRYILKKGE